MDPRPFPFAALPRWTRAEVTRARDVVRALTPGVFGTTVQTEALWRHVFDAAPVATPSVPRVCDRAALGAAHAETTFAVVGVHPTLGVVVALVDRVPALTLAARALGLTQAEANALGAAGELTSALEGALAMLVARTVAVALSPAPAPCVRGVTESVALALDALDDAPARCLAWPWRVAVGPTGGTVTLVTRADLPRPVEPLAPWMLDRMADAGVRVSVVAGRAVLPARAVAGLCVSDVLTLDGVRRWENALAGTVDVALGHPARVMVTGELHGWDGVAITGGVRPWRRLDVGDTDDDAKASTAVLADLPVEVVVEIAHGTVSVGEVAAWRTGEVVTFGQRLGDVVTVRAGGRAVARGELVDVDGEVGVRLTTLL